MKILLSILSVILCIILVLTINVIVASRKTYDPAPADAVIVLGARVKPTGVMSLTLMRRTEKGAEAYQKGLAKTVIVCGGQGADEPVSEAKAMAQYLTGKGIPEEDILLEDRSVNTYENLKNAQAIMAEHGLKTAIIVTSDYHIRRALWLAGDAQLDAQGYPSKGPDDPFNKVKAYVQESISWIKYAITRNFNN